MTPALGKLVAKAMGDGWSYRAPISGTVGFHEGFYYRNGLRATEADVCCALEDWLAQECNWCRVTGYGNGSVYAKAVVECETGGIRHVAPTRLAAVLAVFEKVAK